MNQFLHQETEIVRKRDFSGLLFVREVWVMAQTVNAPECPTFDSELVGHSVGGNFVRVWFLLRPRGDYLDGCEWPPIPDLDRRSITLVDPRVQAGVPSAIVHVGGDVAKAIKARERKFAASRNAYWDAYSHPRREVSTSAAPSKKFWEFWK